MCFFPRELEMIEFNSHKNLHLFQFFLLLLLQGDDSDGSNFTTLQEAQFGYTLQRSQL